VTHDQEEALAISGPYAVMRAGRVNRLQARATSTERPTSPFVASFVGMTNLLNGTIRVRDGDAAEVSVAGATCGSIASRAGGDKVVCRCGRRLALLAGGERAGRWARLPDARRDRVSRPVTRFAVTLRDGAVHH
jgi:ABC-type proline/glycine betaine transport system ATPase subunit